MNRYIAYCGLDCKKCDAFIATVNNDDALREKTAKLWSELNGVPITADMIHCEGCRMDGRKTPFCDAYCQIRKCAKEKQVETCADCVKMNDCEKVSAILGNSEEAAHNLNQMKKEKEDF